MFLNKNKFLKIIRNNPFVLFTPFLLFYLVIIILLSKTELVGDEGRYLMFANHLLNGYYSPPSPNINLWNGPGYPLLIAPLLYFKLPYFAIRALNGILLYLSLIFTFKTINEYSSKKVALLFTSVLGLYYPIYKRLPLIITEPLAWFLISLISFLFVRSFKQNKAYVILLTSFSITFLALTKIIFGYVIIVMLIVSVFFYFVPIFHSGAKKLFIIFLMSFIFSLPYLFYTYNLTHKLFYWGNSGGMSLYTMSTPFEDEYGDWHNFKILLNNSNHASFIDSISQLDPLKRDEAFKNKAIENIKNHPKKYLRNWIANVGRLFFSYPYSNTKQTLKTYFTIVPNMYIIVIISFSIILGAFRYKFFPQELIFLLFFILVYLFGSTLLSAYRRMFYITLPFWILFISYVFSNIISIKFKKVN